MKQTEKNGTKKTEIRMNATTGRFTMTPSRKTRIKKGAEDFAVRFEKVMKELANG